MDEFLAAVQNINFPGTNGLNFELIKYERALRRDDVLNFINMCSATGHIPED